VRDLTVKDDDLIAATHGRGFWILDDVTPLRQISAQSADAEAILFKPETAYRVRWNTNTDTPLPPDESNLQNPPEGAIIDYYLKSGVTGPVTIEIIGADKKPVRRYSSADPVEPLPVPQAATLPLYWYRAPQSVSAAPGMHRFTWDVHYQPLAAPAAGGRGGLPIAAVPRNTVPAPSTPWVNPGEFTVRLTVNGKAYTQPLTVKQDPRVKTAATVMADIYSLTRQAYYGALDAEDAGRAAQNLRDQLNRIQPRAPGPSALDDLDRKLAAWVGGPGAPVQSAVAGVGRPAGAGAAGAGRGGGSGAVIGTVPASASDTLATISLSGVMNLLQGADAEPPANQLAAMRSAIASAERVMARWEAIKTVDVPAVNARLSAAGLAPLVVK
jgi:hypothetical protein